MTFHGASGPSDEGAYGGFSASEPPRTRAFERLDVPRPETRMYAPREYRRRGSAKRRLGVVLVGVLAALGAGLAFGYLGRVDLRPAPEPPPPPDVSALTDEPVAPAPAPTSGAVTPEEVARIALGEGAPVRPAVTAPPAMAQPVPVRKALVPKPPARVQETAPATRRVAVAAPVRALQTPARIAEPPAPTPAPVARAGTPNFRPAFHCDWRLRPSEAMICADPQLSAYDRELNRAFRLAVEAGAPRAWLREDQDEWVFERERVARRGGPEAVAEAYRRRIAELQALYD